jgi:Spy/CpxP family protein refolding chaperone
MKTWKKVSLALSLALVVGGGTAIAANAHRGGDFQQRITARVNRMLDKLNATPDQRQKINDITKNALTQLQALRQSNAQDHGEWINALTADNFDENTLKAKAVDHATQMANIIVPALHQVHDVLTKDQRTQLGTMMKNHHGPQTGFGGPDQ